MGEVYRRAPRLTRRFTVGWYVIYYEPIADGVQVLRILHGARNHKGLI